MDYPLLPVSNSNQPHHQHHHHHHPHHRNHHQSYHLQSPHFLPVENQTPRIRFNNSAQQVKQVQFPNSPPSVGRGSAFTTCPNHVVKSHPSFPSSSSTGTPNDFNFPLRSQHQQQQQQQRAQSSNYQNPGLSNNSSSSSSSNNRISSNSRFTLSRISEGDSKELGSSNSPVPEVMNNNNSHSSRGGPVGDGSVNCGQHGASPPPPPASQQTGVQPQYRIFKRGETIPGFSSPLALIPQGTVGQQESVAKAAVEQQQDVSSSVLNDDGVKGEPPAGGVDASNNLEDCETGNGGKCQQQQQRGSGSRTAISLVADIARFHNVLAEYRLTNESGPPHAPTFTVVLNLGEESYQAQGPSIKKAQLAAAGTALEQTAFKTPPPRSQPKKAFQAGRNPKRANWTIMRLNALAEELGEKISFTSQPVQIINPFNRADPPSVVAVNIGERVFTGEGHNVNAAKNSAALAALKVLSQQKKERELSKMLLAHSDDPSSNGTTTTVEDETLDAEIKSPISIVHEMALKRGLKVSFEILGEHGPPHMKVFNMRCKVGPVESDGEGPTKQAAKKASCEAMMTRLKEVPLKQPNLSSLKSLQNGLKGKPKVTRKKPTTPVIKEVKTQVVSPISRLLQIAHIRKYKEPEFRVVGQNDGGTDGGNGGGGGAPERSQDRRSKRKKPFFTMEVVVGPYVCQGSGSNKKMAKKAAADAALVTLGYAPTTETKEEADRGQENGVKGHHGDESGGSEGGLGGVRKAEVKITGARQIVPGVLVLKSDNGGDSSVGGNSVSSAAAAAQEMNKVNSLAVNPGPASSVNLDGIRKLAYLADLLGISVSYSDFPKKNEFLSVASLGTNPPHVAHGIGPTREEAQNSAAVQILEELSSSGLDGVTPARNGQLNGTAT